MNQYTTDYPRNRANRKQLVGTNKILVAIPFWQGDKAAASKLIRLLTDIEQKHSEWADVVLVSRFDCKHDPKDIELASRRFNVHTLTSRRRETGWPAGCNGLFFGTYEWFAGSVAANAIPPYKAILINEADTVPLARDWAEKINRAWDAAQKPKPSYVAGAMVAGAKFGKQHINGGCVMLSSNPKFAKWLLGVCARYTAIAGWDWALAAEFEKQGWADVPSMVSMWNRQSITLEETAALSASGVVLAHGVKGDSMQKHARTLLVR